MASMQPQRVSLQGSSRGLNSRAQVYEFLREATISGELPPGTALSENELAKRYGVSRTPIREALIRLANEDLVEVLPQRGTFVSRVSVREVKEMQFIRETLERASLPQAIERITAQDERYLRSLLDEQEVAGRRGDLKAWFETDEELHRTLLEIAGHPKVWAIVNAAKAHLDRLRWLGLPEAASLDDLLNQHREIVDYVVGKRQREAEAVLTRHLRLALETLETLKENHPDYFIDDIDDVLPERRVERVRRS